MVELLQSRRAVNRIRGQAALELALTLPLLLLLALGVLQLFLLRQARLLMEYAAFCAVRIGVVTNGEPERMRRAALLATLPLYGRANTREALLATSGRQRALALRLPPLVQVAPIGTASRQELARATSRNGGDWQEVAFDRGGTFAEGETAPDPISDAALSRVMLLSIRVEALYELKVPVVDSLFFWAASRGRGSQTEERALRPSVLAEGPSGRRRYFVPVSATYAMRMQSDLFRKWAAP